MGQNLEDKIPNGGMNRDDENRLVDKSEYRYALNVRVGSSDDDNVGAIENIKGNTEVTFSLPIGRNKVIGSFGDQTTNSNFFFLWNSLGHHTIYRYLNDTGEVRILTQDTSDSTDGELLSFKEFDLINDINVIDDLLYWRDKENPPRKINFEKADNDNIQTRQVFNWYLGDDYLSGLSNFDLTIEIRSSRYDTVLNTYTTSFPVNTSLEEKTEIAKDLSEKINSYFLTTLSSDPADAESESCGEFVTITTKNSLFYKFLATKSGDETPMIVPQNHYVGYIERTIDVIKHPFHCELKGIVKTDETFHRNYIDKKVFQFAARIIYDDDEKSTVNPYSTHIYNPFICEQFTGEDISNYIELDLSVFPELNDVLALQTIKRIEIFFRDIDQDTKLQSLWKSVTTLEQYKFVDTGNQHYDFYNDAIYDVVDQNDFVRPFDLVPQRTKNQEVAKNRMFYGNNLEGYDNICVDAQIDIEYDDVESRIKAPTHSVEGFLFIRAMFNGNINDSDANPRRHSKYQAIRKDGIAYPVTGSSGGLPGFPTVWGGMSEGAGADPEVWNMAEKTGQILPLDGFTVYLAGTDFYDITDQNIGDSFNNVGQNTKGVYQNTSNSDMIHLTNKIRENLRAANGITFSELQKLLAIGEEPTQAYSTFRIENVPDGWYMLRVASHTTTSEDLQDIDRAWQRTSTNVYQITNMDALSNPAIVGNRQSAIRGRNELLVEVRGGSIGNIKIEIMDMSHASDFGSSKIMTGYVADNDLQNPVSTYDNILLDTRIARAAVGFDINPGGTNYDIFPANVYCSGRSALTDHNGYFYYGSIDGFSAELNICNVRSADVPSTNYVANDVKEKNGKPTVNIEEDEFVEVAIRVAPGNTYQNRVWVQGSIRDNLGRGIPKASVVSTRAEVFKCDFNGDYGFWHYGILETSAGNPSLDTFLIPIRTALTCSAFYDQNQIYNYSFNYPSWWQGYSGNGTPFIAPNQVNIPSSIPLMIGVPFFLGDVSNLSTLNAMKRGGDWKYGLVYYDRGMRSGSVNTIDRLSKHIPFYSERDSDGDIKIGVPVLNWEIKHRPPSWATHYQWLRTRNSTVGDYYQWAVKDISYETSDGTPATFSSGTRVVLDVSNLNTYRNQYPTMDLEVATDAETYRVRFIKNQNGVRYSDYFDFKVLEVNGNLIKIEKEFDLGEIDQGALVEIYNEKLDIENDIYYEFGECFEVKENINGVKYHSGLDQDQDPLTPSSVPAKGTFRTGDAYYRLRGIPDGGANGSSYIDDDAISDFYPSEVESIGRANGENPDSAQIWKPNQLRHSGKFIPDSKINNLSMFESADFNNLPIEYGSINKLQLAANVLISIQDFRWISNYIEEVITRKQAGGDNLEATTDVFGSFRAAKAITGTINQESVVEYNGAVYAYDMNKGAVYRWAGDGLTPIHTYKMMNYFTDKSADILNNMRFSVDPVRVVGVYDPKFDEYILSFSEVAGDISILEPRTEDVSPSYRLGFNINNSQTIETAPDNSLYSVKSEKESGSNFIIDESTSPDLVGAQIDNRVDSIGVLRVKVKEYNGRVREVVILEPGQGIRDFNLKTGDYIPKSSTDDNPNTSSLPLQTIFSTCETVAFSERLNKWTTFYSFKPEMFGIINLSMISFVGGKLWIHNTNKTRNNFYGVQYASQVEILFNDLPGQVKVFQAVGVESGHPWHVPSAKTPKSGKYPDGMETEIVAGRFQCKEESFFAPVMRDKNDPLFVNKPSIEAILNGRQLRARSIRVMFENNETEEVVLFATSMQSTLSSRHQQ